MKSAANIVGSAFFAAGYEVQDAPRYGAERRGAPMFAYVRAAHAPIIERGAIAVPDLVIVADPTLLAIAAAGVMQGASAETLLFVNSTQPAEALRSRLRYPGRVVSWPDAGESSGTDASSGLSAMCAGAAARMVGVIPQCALGQALDAENAGRGAAAEAFNRSRGLAAYEALTAYAGAVREGLADAQRDAASPDWIRLSAEDSALGVPDIFTQANSQLSNTGLWRTSRPVIDYEHCNRCSWICSTLCPDSAIHVDADRTPRIDYDHCKGCMMCVFACPPHAIRQVPEHMTQPAGDR